MAKVKLTHFQRALVAAQKVVSARELALLSGMSEGSLSQYKSGMIRPKAESLAAMIKAFVPHPALADKLLRAHLLDECPEEYCGRLERILKKHKLISAPTEEDAGDTTRDQELELAVDAYRQAALGDPELRRIIIEVARKLL